MYFQFHIIKWVIIILLHFLLIKLNKCIARKHACSFSNKFIYLFFHYIIIGDKTINTSFTFFVYSSSSYCLDLVRKRDHEHFLATLLLPKEIRPAALAIRAFNVELASVRDSVTDQVLKKAFPRQVRFG